MRILPRAGGQAKFPATVAGAGVLFFATHGRWVAISGDVNAFWPDGHTVDRPGPIGGEIHALAAT